MDYKNNTRQLLLKLIETYPLAQPEDIFKFIFQSAFGCEHLVSDEKAVLEYIKREYENADKSASPLSEKLDGNYSRIYLSNLNVGMRTETLARIFCLSAKSEISGRACLEEKIDVLCELMEEGCLPFESESFYDKLYQWKKEEYPALHHSEKFRNAYRPAYRVVADRYTDFLDLFVAIDKLLDKRRLIVAIEGGSASGKTTLAEVLQEVYDCSVFHMDDYFLRPEQRTPQRYAEIGGNVDRERFSDEVLGSLVLGNTVRYRPFDCSIMSLGDEVTVEPRRLTVVEGVYSAHPAFSKYYDIAVFLDISPDYQRDRIFIRNSPMLAKRFFDEWIPLENKYFSATDIKKRSDIIIPVVNK